MFFTFLDSAVRDPARLPPILPPRSAAINQLARSFVHRNAVRYPAPLCGSSRFSVPQPPKGGTPTGDLRR